MDQAFELGLVVPSPQDNLLVQQQQEKAHTQLVLWRRQLGPADVPANKRSMNITILFRITTTSHVHEHPFSSNCHRIGAAPEMNM